MWSGGRVAASPTDARRRSISSKCAISRSETDQFTIERGEHLADLRIAVRRIQIQRDGRRRARLDGHVAPLDPRW
jgi:hypothetical protein